MAAYPFDASYTGAPFFDIYNDASAAIPSANIPSLPGGACNYVDLTPGANGSRCGCRRFWIRSAAGSPALDGGWCMCNHHACYHDQRVRDEPVSEPRGPGQENERPRTEREPLSPVVDLTANMPHPIAGLDLPVFPVDNLSFITNIPEDQVQDPRIAPTLDHQPSGSLPDTLPWVTAPSQAHSNKLAPVNSQGPMPSQATSTTSSLRAKYLRPFAGKGLHTLGVAGGTKAASHSQIQLGKPGSTTPRMEPADPEGSFVFVAQDQYNVPTPQADGDTQTEPRATISDTVTREALKNLSDTVGGHEQRLDRLETVSFSGAGHDECHERHEHVDLRLTELESRMEDVEKSNTEHGSAIARLTDKNDDAATQSVVSFSTAGTSRPTHSQEIYSQLQSLQAQVNSLQYALPSYTHPWEVEVVFLPFPLKKVWQEMHQFKTEPGVSGDDWTQLPMTYSSRAIRSHSPFYGEWATGDHDAEWLLPRACGDKSIIDKRLRSRGLIKKVSVRGCDARSVQIAMNAVFSDAWREMDLPTCPQSPDARFSKFMGLRSAWVPLRKIHKDSRLRFLSPAEMLNPTLWDVQFLNSVMMRSSEPRLFVTHPDAYLQDYQAYESGWTWQKLRELTRVYPGVDESQEVPEGDALEEYWSWNEQYDEPPSARTSMSLRNQRQRTSTSSPSQQHFPTGQSWRSSSPAVAVPGPASRPSDRRRVSLPPHIQTASVPISAPGHPSPALSRRRVVSHGQSRRSSPSVRGTSQFAVLKRRRTRSPSYARYTPRWTASPSPMPTGFSDRQHIRGTTPFAYATPHSNAPLQEVRPVRAGSAAPIPPEYMADMDHELDELFDIEIYESESDGSFDDGDSEEAVTHGQAGAMGDSQEWPLPEDEPWPGIEDQEHMSDGENIDPNKEADRQSDASSQPSEYPSTQRLWPEDQGGFQIHEDDEP